MPTEVEAKYLATAAALDALGRATTLGDADLGLPRAFDEVDRYLDTADGRLAAVHWACRLRDRGAGPIVSLKGPADSVDGAIHRRPELEGPAADSLHPEDWPSSDARDLLLRLAGAAPLAERVRLEQRRVERSVRVGEHHVGTLSLDTVVVRHAERAIGDPMHVVELELASDDAHEPLRSLAASLSSLPGLTADASSKLEHALARVAAASGGNTGNTGL